MIKSNQQATTTSAAIKDQVDQQKRQTLKMAAGISTGAFLGTTISATSALAGTKNSSIDLQPLDLQFDDILNCTLISKKESDSAYLLMSNPTDNDIVVSSFNSALIRFDNGSSFCPDVCTETIIVSAHEEVMVKFKMIPGLQTETVASQIVDINSSIKFLPEGTRVSLFTAKITDGVGEISTLGYSSPVAPAIPA